MKRALLFLASALGIATAPAASAYLDPGTGSVILQGLLAGAAGVAVVGRLYWARVKSSLDDIFGRKPPPEQPSDSEHQDLAAPPDR